MNGLEYIMVHLPHIWEEIQEIVDSIDAETCKTKVSKEKTKRGKLLYSPVDLNKEFKKLLEAKDWKESRTSYYVTSDPKLIRDTYTLEPKEQKKRIEKAGFTPLKSYNQTDFVKDRVAIEVQLGKYPFVAYDLFVKHMAFYVGDQIDVGVEILPTKKLSSEMSSGVSYYEGELYNVIRQGRGVPAVPLVIIGVEQ
jgi:hypothetical protein